MRRFSVARSLKLGSFHIGSAMGDLLTSAVWNRVLIVDLGIAAWPVALLSALRYLMAPLSLWAGHRSDTRPLLGSRRIAYIWLGRLLMLLALPLLPASLFLMAAERASPSGWGLAFLSFVLYGAGTLISGPPFLALVHDSTPYERRGQAIGIVQTMLIASFAFVPMLYAALMPTYDQGLFLRLVLVGMGGASLLWLFSIWGGERPRSAAPREGPPPLLRQSLKEMWSHRSARRYAAFLATAAFFGFMQDAVLEPFGGDVFGLSVGETTRFNAYWGGGVLVGMLATVALTRNRRPEQQVGPTSWGLAAATLPLLALALASLLEALTWVTPVLVLFGLGFGVYTAGGVGLLMAMSSERRAGSYLALWSVIHLVARGAGIAAGGAARDLALGVTGSFHSAYAAVFALEAIGLAAAIVILQRVDVASFAASGARFRPGELLEALPD